MWLCEVSTHTRGLGGYRGDPVAKLATKLLSVRAYADAVFPGAKRHLEFWSPRVRPGPRPGLTALSEQDGVTLVINDVYAERVRELVGVARKISAYNDHRSFRMLQILTCLRPNP